MDTAREQRKRKAEPMAVRSGPVGGDVFDRLGNEGLRAHVDQLRAPEEPEVSVLSGIEPELTKEQALGEEGEQVLRAVANEAAGSLGGGPLDSVAQSRIGELILEELEVDEIVEAREAGRLEALIRGVLRQNALRSRDEVIFHLQDLLHEDGELQEMLLSAEPGALAVALIEHLAVMLVDLDDLHSLAASDHADILEELVIGDDALTARRTLSPRGLRMGGFATVLYQMLVDELTLRPLPLGAGSPGSGGAESDPGALVDPYSQNLLSLVARLRRFRAAA